MTTDVSVAETRPPADELVGMADFAVGVSVAAARWMIRGGRVGARLAGPVVPAARRMLGPGSVGGRLWPGRILQATADRGRQERTAALAAATRAASELVPRLLDAVLDQIDLTALVIDRVDLDAVAAHLDLDAAAARIDVEAVVDRVDLIGLAHFVIDGVDLPDIIRESTGSMASEGIRGVRMQAIDADERVGRLVDRMLLRRHARQTDTTISTPLHDQHPDGEGPS